MHIPIGGCAAACAVLFIVVLASAASPPATPKKPVTDVYHGIKVVDDYRWLEDASNPAVRSWSAAQNQFARLYLDALPARASLYERLKKLRSYPSPRYFSLTYRRDVLFAIKRQPPKEQPFLVTLASPDAPGSEHVIIDPNQLNTKGTTAIDFYVPSLDGKYVAVSLSEGGSESGDVHVYEVADGKPLADVIPRVNGGTAGGSLAWNVDGTGFYYTRYPRGSERPKQDIGFYQQVYFHRRGTRTEDDTYALGKEFPRIAEIALENSDDGRYILATMANGDGGEFVHYLLGPGGEWRQITRLADQVSSGIFGLDGNLYLLSRQGAPRGKILRLPLKAGGLADAKVVVPESKGVIESFLPTPTALYVNDLVGGPSRMRIFDLDGHERGTVPVNGMAAIGEMVRHKDELLFECQSYTEPPAWYRFELSSKKVSRTGLYQTAAADFSDVEVRREFATSKDGTKIPLNIIARKGTALDGSNPTVLYGYGGFGVSLTPAFSVRVRPLLDHGVIYVMANLRGGGEYGEDWHDAGKLTRKQNVFDDLAAAARHLIERRYTSSAKLAIEGGSNGGLLMGAALTQHPELFRAVVSHVGLYDMLRVELHPNGAFNVTEFGTVKELDQFRAIYAYSPYHHVVDGTQYPAVFFLTGDNDPRVDPANSRKMTARLQATGTKLPVLLRTSTSSGHGIGSALSEVIAQEADVFAFLFDQLGVK
ncbi:MAG TPA: prolyl oligopeptidase family serine peptidase [Steroidobacteraceae bacterium]|nr:prolyl oligopeptidase family serine peptidase [Steroidobacteraceae bacterium]